MGRLKALPGRLTTLKPMLGALPLPERNDEAQRAAFAPYRAWYKTSRWQALRMDVLVRDGFTCQCGCGVIEPDTSRLVADHRIAHRGDATLFWDATNLQTLRKSPCHDRLKQRAELAERRRR